MTQYPHFYDVNKDISNTYETTLELLQRFQHLLVGRLFTIEKINSASTNLKLRYISPLTESEIYGASCLLRKYLILLYYHLKEILPCATHLAAHSNKHFAVVSQIIQKDITGMIVYYNVISKKGEGVSFYIVR